MPKEQKWKNADVLQLRIIVKNAIWNRESASKFSDYAWPLRKKYNPWVYLRKVEKAIAFLS